jgi:hypothetical protein
VRRPLAATAAPSPVARRRRRWPLVTAAASIAAAAVLFGAPLAQAATGDGSPTDPNVKFVGRWDTTSSAAYVPSWTGAYLRTKFTGTTLKLKQRAAVNMYVSIDGGDYVFYAGVKNTVNLTPTALPSATHTVQVEYRSGDTVFQGFVLDSGAKTVDPGLTPKLIEFVGDSITLGALTSKLSVTSYGWLTGEKLGVRHTQIARSGYCLVVKPNCAGQSVQFFKLGSTGDTNWDFSRYQASAVVINLGTNDIGQGTTNAEFQAAYTKFIKDIHAKYPNAAIVAMETFKRRYVTETQNAVKAATAAGVPKVSYVNTEGWLIDNVDYADGTGHPNDAGHVKVTNKLAPILKPLIGL